jgi:hypothetical protein
MAGNVSSSRRRKSSMKPRRNRLNLQKPNGVIAPRVKKVGGEKFGIVCVDPAKHRSEWMMADYFGNVLIEPRTVEHQRGCFDVAVDLVRQTQTRHDIRDMIVVVERTGNYHLTAKRAFAHAGFETRVVHPFTGRSGLYPSRHQSDQTDRDSGRIVRQANRRLRCALMRIADNLVGHCSYYRGKAEVDRSRGIHERAIRVKTAKRFSRLAYACLAGDQTMRHPCFRNPDSILVKLRVFHHQHQTPLDLVLPDLETVVTQLPGNIRHREADIVALALNNTVRKGGVSSIGDLLPAVLARLRSLNATKTTENGDRP